MDNKLLYAQCKYMRTDYIYVKQNKNCIYSIFFFFFVFYIESLESPKMTSVQTISEFCGI